MSPYSTTRTVSVAVRERVHQMDRGIRNHGEPLLPLYLLWGKVSDKRLATVKPEVPPPATMKSYWGRSCETWRLMAGWEAPLASPTTDATMAHDSSMVAPCPLWQGSEMLQLLGTKSTEVVRPEPMV